MALIIIFLGQPQPPTPIYECVFLFGITPIRIYLLWNIRIKVHMKIPQSPFKDIFLGGQESGQQVCSFWRSPQVIKTMTCVSFSQS